MLRLLLFALSGAGPTAAAAPVPDPPVLLSAADSGLARELVLAAGDRPYLVLDVAAGRLTLKRNGAVLESYQVLAAEQARPRVGEAPGSAAELLRLWTDGRRRPGLRPAVSLETARKAEVPPLPQDLYPAPRNWAVHYREGLVVEFAVDDPSPSLRNRWGNRLRETWSRLVQRSSPRLRLSLALDVQGRLYRGLPEGAAFLIRPPVASGPSGGSAAGGSTPPTALTGNR